MPEPVVSVTPPARNTRPKRLRLYSGMSRTYSLLTSVPRVALSVSSRGGASLTSTVMLKPTGFRLKFRLDCWSTANTTFLLSRPESLGLHLDGVGAGTQTSQEVEPMVISADAGGHIGA